MLLPLYSRDDLQFESEHGSLLDDAIIGQRLGEGRIATTVSDLNRSIGDHDQTCPYLQGDPAAGVRENVWIKCCMLLLQVGQGHLLQTSGVSNASN
jgi:hypothetical protein